jgi:cytochrome c-type biogenesis protein CcmH/NrfF
LPRFLVPCLLFATLCGAAPPAPGNSVEQAYDEAARTILCDCGCHPQSVHDCVCGRAAEMREEIHGLAVSGMTGEEIVARYVERHGPQIRVTPTATGFNLVAWVGPLVGLVLCSVGLAFLLRRWTRRPKADAAPVPAPPVPAGDPYGERLERALERFE